MVMMMCAMIILSMTIYLLSSLVCYDIVRMMRVLLYVSMLPRVQEGIMVVLQQLRVYSLHDTCMQHREMRAFLHACINKRI